MLVKAKDFYSFLNDCVNEKLLEVSEVILPAKSQSNTTGKTFFKVLSKDREFLINENRSADPAKILFYSSRERMRPEELQNKKRIIAGIKACDLKAIKLLDKALINDEFTDPAYKHWRDNSIIITADCTSISESCHCNLVEGKPFAEEGFDLNISTIDENFVLLSGSSNGDELIKLIKEIIDTKNISDNDRDKIKENRNAIISLLDNQNVKYKRNGNPLELRNCEPDLWKDSSKECVGCSACTNVCPTCYCLILNDESEAEKFVKVRSTDSCQYNGYARVAGGGTPRPKMYQRFRNRYLCKFDYMKSNFNEIGCTGCGRCIDACPANIDFREVISLMICEPVSKSEQV